MGLLQSDTDVMVARLCGGPGVFTSYCTQGIGLESRSHGCWEGCSARSGNECGGRCMQRCAECQEHHRACITVAGFVVDSCLCRRSLKFVASRGLFCWPFMRRVCSSVDACLLAFDTQQTN